MNNRIPYEAEQVLSVVERHLGDRLLGAYLFGSAVVGGLRVNSDIDVLAVIDNRLADDIRHTLTRELMEISGRIGNADSTRPLELVVINRADVVPWRYPPRIEFIYGEWLRADDGTVETPMPAVDPDLTIALIKTLQNSIVLYGPDVCRLLDPVPSQDMYRALGDALPELMKEVQGDERNVLLTLARMWSTAATGQIVPKDVAAAWAIKRLPPALGAILALARRGYLGEAKDRWEDKHREVSQLVSYMSQATKAHLKAIA